MQGGDLIKIKTREALKNIRVVDRAEMLAQRIEGGVSRLYRTAEQTRGGEYETATDYASGELQDKQGRIAQKTTGCAANGVDRVGRWGAKKAGQQVRKWINKTKDLRTKKKLPNPSRQVEKAEKGIKTTVRGIKTASDVTKATVKATVKGSKFAVRTVIKAIPIIKKAAAAVVELVKAAAKAIVAGVKAAVVGIKGLIAAIASGGWVAVLIIVLILVMTALVATSAFAIFIPNEKHEMDLYRFTQNLEYEFEVRKQSIADREEYDILLCEGELAPWEEVIAVYAVKLNLDSDNPQEVATFDEDKAAVLRAVFWDMHDIDLISKTVTTSVIRQETDQEGNMIEVTKEICTVYLTVITASKSAAQMANEYGFSAEQMQMLDDLLDVQNAELWAGILGK